VLELGLGVVPGGSLANKAINTSLAAGNSKNGQVGAWTGIGNTNGTLNMAPGGLLAQNIASVSTHGRSNAEMNRFVPDPKKAAIGGLMAMLKNPTQVKSVVSNSTLSGMSSIASTVSSAKPSFGSAMSSVSNGTLQMAQQVKTAPKPSIFSNIMPPSMAIPFKKNTISSEDTSSYEEGEKMSIMESMLAPDPDSNPRPPPMTTLGNQNLQRAVGTPDTFASPSDMSTSSMLPFVALACVLVLVVMR
jgi:hypothetical protein